MGESREIITLERAYNNLLNKYEKIKAFITDEIKSIIETFPKNLLICIKEIQMNTRVANDNANVGDILRERMDHLNKNDILQMCRRDICYNGEHYKKVNERISNNVNGDPDPEVWFKTIYN